MNTKRSALAGLGLPAVFLLLCLAFGATELHFDVLERSYLIEHVADCIRARNGSPQSQFLFYGHMLELPLAWVLGLRWLGLSGTQALILFESLCGAATLYIVYRLVRLWGGGIPAAVVAQLVLLTSLSFWRMSSGGEERIAGLAAQMGFLWAFWHALRTGRRTWTVAATLPLAILVHLSSLVLVPFAAAALWFVDPESRLHRVRVARAVGVGTVVAGILFVAIAAATTGVRTPSQLFEYATLYHRTSGTNFFELLESKAPGSRLGRMFLGAGSFFGVAPWGRIALVVLAMLMTLGAYMLRRGIRRGPATDNVGSKTAVSPPAGSRRTLRGLGIHTLLLAALWTLHFAFYQPTSYESWTLPLATSIVVAAVLWSGVAAVPLLVLPLMLVPANWSYMLRLHREDPLDRMRDMFLAATAPGDVIVFQAGRVHGDLTEGSLAYRYLLVEMRDRRLASLHDILHVGDGEYWRAPYRSAAELQAAINAGTRVVTPTSLVPVYEKLAATGALAIGLEPATAGVARVREFRPLHEYSFTPEQLSIGPTRPARGTAPPGHH